MSTGQAAVRWRVWWTWWLVRSGLEHLGRARRASAALAAQEGHRVRFDGRRPTVADLRVLASALAIGAGPRPVRPGGESVRFAGRGLTAVNAVVVAVVLGRVLGADPAHPGLLVAAVVLAGCGATAQAVLARDVGRRLRPFAATPGLLEPPLSRVVGAGLLAVGGGLAGVAAWGWAQWAGPGSLAVLSGLFLAASALAAPFLLVATEVHGPDPDTRLLGRAERILSRRDRRCHRIERRVGRLVGTAQRRLWRAERGLAAVEDLIGAEHPRHLADAVERLRAELAAFVGGPAGAEPPLDPDDLDLAG